MTRYEGPVVVETSDADPGDMGEPRTFTQDDVTYLTVPPPEAWGWQADAADLQTSFNMRWNADMRAIRRWQDAHPGKELVWPDHADLVVWLMGALERADHLILDSVHRDDHACAECVPGGPIVVPGFRCVFHEAKAR